MSEYTVANAYSADAAIPSHRITVEAHGPWHYLADKVTLTGRAQLRMRLLQALGWRTLVVHFSEWRRLTAAEKLAFMQSNLQRLVTGDGDDDIVGGGGSEGGE